MDKEKKATEEENSGGGNINTGGYPILNYVTRQQSVQIEMQVVKVVIVTFVSHLILYIDILYIYIFQGFKL